MVIREFARIGANYADSSRRFAKFADGSGEALGVAS